MGAFMVDVWVGLFFLVCHRTATPPTKAAMQRMTSTAATMPVLLIGVQSPSLPDSVRLVQAIGMC